MIKLERGGETSLNLFSEGRGDVNILLQYFGIVSTVF